MFCNKILVFFLDFVPFHKVQRPNLHNYNISTVIGSLSRCLSRVRNSFRVVGKKHSYLFGCD